MWRPPQRRIHFLFVGVVKATATPFHLSDPRRIILLQNWGKELGSWLLIPIIWAFEEQIIVAITTSEPTLQGAGDDVEALAGPKVDAEYISTNYDCKLQYFFSSTCKHWFMHSSLRSHYLPLFEDVEESTNGFFLLDRRFPSIKVARLDLQDPTQYLQLHLLLLRLQTLALRRLAIHFPPLHRYR